MKATIVFDKIWKAIHAVNEDGSRKYRYIILTGSSRSSKTASTIQAIDQYCRSNQNKRCTAWRDTKKDCKDTVLKDALTYMKMWGNYKKNQEFNKTESIFTYNTESTFEIHGTDDEEKVMGLNKAVTWINEPYKVSKATNDQLDQRTEDFVIYDWNPKKNHWIEDIAKDPRAIVIHSTFRHNPFCPPEQKIKILSYQSVKKSSVVVDKILTENEAKEYDFFKNYINLSEKQLKELARCRHNEDKRSANDFNWDVYGLGIKAERPNRIYHWNEISIEDYLKINADITVYYSDWGTVDPWAIGEVKYYDGAIYVRELNYLSENQIREKVSLIEISQIAAGDDPDQTERNGIVTWMFAKLGVNKEDVIICDLNRPLKMISLRRAGYQVAGAPKPPGSIIDGIDLLNNMPVFYTSDSENVAYEQENYSRKVDSHGIVLDEPEDVDNHHCDGVRYCGLWLKQHGYIRET